MIISAMQTKMRWLIRIVIIFGIILLVVYKEGNFFHKHIIASHNIDSVKVFYGNSYHTIFITDTLNFAGEPIPVKDSLVRSHLKYILATDSNWIPKAYNMLKYASGVLNTLKKRLIITGVPSDFMYMACNESNFANITSPNGMCGIWQMEPNTARRFGLRVDSIVDERSEISRSTFAACTVYSLPAFIIRRLDISCCRLQHRSRCY